jgi:small subunit ribosomal protein S6
LREYETTIIVQPEISEECTQAIFSKLDGLLESGGATRLMCEDWGKRKLAYEIKKFHKGHYYTLMYLDDGKVVTDIERALRLEESVLRFLTILADEEVTDIEARKADAAEKEVEQAKRAAERAAREAEEAAARREAEEAAAREAAERGEIEPAEGEAEGEAPASEYPVAEEGAAPETAAAPTSEVDAAGSAGSDDEEGARS